MSRKEKNEWIWQIRSDVHRLSDEVLHGVPTSTGVSTKFWNPNIDLCEDDEGFHLVIELAGFDPEKIQLHYSPEKHSLVVRGERTANKNLEAKKCHQLEIWYGEFQRTIPLPEFPIDRDKIRARFVNGILHIIAPKKKETIRKTTIIRVESE